MRSRLGILGAFAAVALVGVLAFALFVAVRHTPRAFTLGVQSAAAVVTLKDGHEVCQGPIDVPAGGAFDRVRFRVGTFGRPGPPVTVTVRDARGATVGRGTLAAGYPDITEQKTHTVALGHRFADGTRGLSVCLRNGGPGRLGVYGNGDAAAADSTAEVDGKAAGVDVEMVFEGRPRTYLGQLGTILDRAVLFRGPRLPGALFAILLVLLVAAALGGLAIALRSIGAPDREAEPDPNPTMDPRR